MEKTKTFAFAAAFMMMMVAGIVVVNTSEDSDATTVSQFGVYVNYGVINGDYSLWDGGNASGYNAYMALSAYCAAHNKSLTADGNYTITTPYTTINTSYGTVSSIDNHPASGTSDTWYGYYFSTVSNTWVPMQVAPGFYKPFSDYDEVTRTANVAFFCGTAADAAIAVTYLPTSYDASGMAQYFSTPLEVSSSTVSATTFRIIPTASSDCCEHFVPDEDQEYMTVIGYGSDAYLALKNAMDTIGCEDYTFFAPTTVVQSNVTSLNTNYSYMTLLFDLAEEGNFDDGWYYWSTYTGLGVNYNNYCSLLLGFYGNGGVAGFDDSTYTLEFVFSPPYNSN